MMPALFKVEVDLVNDPGGRRRVLLQLPDAWITVDADDARSIATALIEAADALGGES